jgi:hypothetical protein
MAERLKAIDCKSIGISYVGSNPTFSKMLLKLIKNFIPLFFAVKNVRPLHLF